MPCDRAPKSSLAGATVVDTSGGRAEAPQWLGASQSYRGTRTGRRDTRVAREPERPCHFRRDCRLESRLTNSRLIHSYVPSWWGRTGDEPTVLPRQESFASLHILTRRASEGSEALPSLARRVRMSFFGARVISPNEGNEVRRDERQRVGAFHSNVEAGELDRRTPRSEGDAVSTDCWRETWRVHRNPWTCPRNNNG